MKDMYALIPLAGMMLGALGIIGWMFNNWVRARHGYPLEDDDGNPVHRTGTVEDRQMVKLLEAENGKLLGQVSRLEERIAVLERIATDPAARTAREIEALR